MGQLLAVVLTVVVLIIGAKAFQSNVKSGYSMIIYSLAVTMFGKYIKIRPHPKDVMNR